MSESLAQLIVIVGGCAMICLAVVSIVWEETYQIKKARGAASSRLAEETFSSANERSSLEAAPVSPDHARQGEAIGRSQRSNKVHDEYEELGQIGFTRSQIDRLVTYRDAYRAGRYRPNR
jgi:hypothetical protein